MATPVSLPPFMVRFPRQSGVDTDCAVAALSSLLGVTYGQALIHCAKAKVTNVLTEGMSPTQAKAAAKDAGVKTKILTKFDVTEDTGILFMSRNGVWEHGALLWAGRICDGDGTLWLDPEDYFRHNAYKPEKLLVRVDE